MNVLTRVIAVACLVTLATGCAGSSPPQTVFSAQIAKSSFHGRWPVTPAAGVLACDTSKGAGAVTFTPQGSSVTYAINAPALDWAKTTGWPDSKEIWNGENWGDFIDAGLKMCDNKSGTPPPPPPRDFPENNLRGLYSPIAYWDNTFAPAAVADCVAEGAAVAPPGDVTASFNVTHAWHLPGGALACVPDADPVAGGRVSTVDLYFPDPGTGLQAVLDVTQSVLPADAAHIKTLRRTNPPGSQHPRAGCQVELYSSNILAGARDRFDPRARSQPYSPMITVELSSGRPSADGYSDQPLDPTSVHDAAITIGNASLPGPDGNVPC